MTKGWWLRLDFFLRLHLYNWLYCHWISKRLQLRVYSILNYDVPDYLTIFRPCVCSLNDLFFSLPIYKRFLARSIHNSPHQQSRTSCFPKDCFAAPQIVSYCPNYICSTNCQCLSNVCLSGQTVRSLITTNTCMTQAEMWFIGWMQGTDGKTNEAVLQALACVKGGGGGVALTLDVHWVSSIPEAGIQYKN